MDFQIFVVVINSIIIKMRYTGYALAAIYESARGQANVVPRPSMRLQDNLEEPDDLGFCIDFKGFGQNIQLESV